MSKQNTVIKTLEQIAKESIEAITRDMNLYHQKQARKEVEEVRELTQ